MTKRHNRTGALLCAAAVLLWCMALMLIPASAAEKTGTLELWCVKDQDIVDGMHWQIYRVGHRDKNDYVFEDRFANYKPTLGDRTKPMLEWDAETVSGAAETLRVYAITEELPNRGEGNTDEFGKLQFGGLEDGLYLVVGEILKKGTKTYIPSAIFFEMNGQEQAHLNAFPKIILETLDKQTADYSVRKVWANDKNQPPDESTYIVSELYRDGKLRETVRLDNSNNWTYEWSDEAGHEWLVKEKEIPKNYSVVYRGNHTQYVIVNTYENPRDDSSSTDVNTTPAASTTTSDKSVIDRQTTINTGTQTTAVQTTAASAGFTTKVMDTGTTARRTTDRTPQYTTTHTVTTGVTYPPGSPGGNTPGTPASPNLPQTGQLWWPVPLLAGGGIVLFGVGLRLHRKDRES